MRVAILYRQFDTNGKLIGTGSKKIRGTLSEIAKACNSEDRNADTSAPQKIIILDEDNFRDPIENKFTDDFEQ